MCTVSTPEHQFVEDVVRNRRKSACLGSEIAPFSCKNAPNRICFTRFNSQKCRGSISARERIALHEGVAAILSRVALTSPGLGISLSCGRGISCRTTSSGLPNAKSQRFSYAISQIATLPPVVALNRSFQSQIAASAAFWHAVPQIALASFL